MLLCVMQLSSFWALRRSNLPEPIQIVRIQFMKLTPVRSSGGNKTDDVGAHSYTSTHN